MSRFTTYPLALHGLVRVQRQPLGDARGFFSRLFCAEELASAGWHWPVAQINHTHTAVRGTVRGLHYQNAPHAEAKLVTCLHGVVWDVALDLRPDSPTFLHWHGEVLSAENASALLIPQGFAHGFQALTDAVDLLYCHSTAFAPQAQGGLHPSDPRLGIAWPLPVTGLSERDASHSPITSTFAGVPL